MLFALILLLQNYAKDRHMKEKYKNVLFSEFLLSNFKELQSGLKIAM